MKRMVRMVSPEVRGLAPRHKWSQMVSLALATYRIWFQ